MPTFAAIDLGATSGRVVNVTIDAGTIALDEVHRFPNAPVGEGAHLAWDFDGLLAEVRAGLAAAAARAPLRSVAVDAWAVDYGLLDAGGRRLGPVNAYRSTRTDSIMERTVARVGDARIYAATGIQFLPFNTAYQLLAHRGAPDYERARLLLMVPDLVNHELCASTTNEVTNASTTQLLDARTHEWDDALVAELGVRYDLLPALHAPGTQLGAVTGVDGADGLTVVAAASHDTASAVAGTPLRSAQPAIYISCGTWALVGCEVAAPITTVEAMRANVTNELGVGGRTRLLKNVTGLWLLEQCRRVWRDRGQVHDVAALVGGAAAQPGGVVVDPDDPRFARATAMPDAIAAACAERGQPVPATPPAVTRVILDSLALAWRTTVATIERIAGRRAEVVHLVGGGAANELLGELCASALGRPVLAGPVEATVVGNALGAGDRRRRRRRSRQRAGARRAGAAATSRRAPPDPRLGRVGGPPARTCAQMNRRRANRWVKTGPYGHVSTHRLRGGDHDDARTDQDPPYAPASGSTPSASPPTGTSSPACAIG